MSGPSRVDSRGVDSDSREIPVSGGLQVAGRKTGIITAKIKIRVNQVHKSSEE